VSGLAYVACGAVVHAGDGGGSFGFGAWPGSPAWGDDGSAFCDVADDVDDCDAWRVVWHRVVWRGVLYRIVWCGMVCGFV
jgi:hypothetical protein